MNIGAYRRRLQELEQSRRGPARAPRDVHRELVDLLRVEAREALQRYLAAEGDAHRGAALMRVP